MHEVEKLHLHASPDRYPRHDLVGYRWIGIDAEELRGSCVGGTQPVRVVRLGGGTKLRIQRQREHSLAVEAPRHVTCRDKGFTAAVDRAGEERTSTEVCTLCSDPRHVNIRPC